MSKKYFEDLDFTNYGRTKIIDKKKDCCGSTTKNKCLECKNKNSKNQYIKNPNDPGGSKQEQSYLKFLEKHFPNGYNDIEDTSADAIDTIFKDDITITEKPETKDNLVRRRECVNEGEKKR